MNGKRKKVNDGVEAAMSAWYYGKITDTTTLARKSIQFQTGMARVQRRLKSWAMRTGAKPENTALPASAKIGVKQAG